MKVRLSFRANMRGPLDSRPPATPHVSSPDDAWARRDGKSYLRSVLQKLQASDRTRAVAIALRRGILDQ